MSKAAISSPSDELVHTLELAATSRYPKELWRWELLAAVYVARAQHTPDVHFTRRNLRAAANIRAWLTAQGVTFGPYWDRDQQVLPGEATLPFISVETILRGTDQPALQVDRRLAQRHSDERLQQARSKSAGT